jgi:hypothetical protein
MTFVEPGLTEAWSRRPDGGPLAAESDVMTLLADVARKD